MANPFKVGDRVVRYMYTDRTSLPCDTYHIVSKVTEHTIYVYDYPAPQSYKFFRLANKKRR